MGPASQQQANMEISIGLIIYYLHNKNYNLCFQLKLWKKNTHTKRVVSFLEKLHFSFSCAAHNYYDANHQRSLSSDEFFSQHKYNCLWFIYSLAISRLKNQWQPINKRTKIHNNSKRTLMKNCVIIFTMMMITFYFSKHRDATNINLYMPSLRARCVIAVYCQCCQTIENSFDSIDFDFRENSLHSLFYSKT